MEQRVHHWPETDPKDGDLPGGAGGTRSRCDQWSSSPWPHLARPGDAVTRLAIILVALPLLVVTVQEAVRNVDRDLVEMAVVFGSSRMQVLRRVIAPGVASPVLTATPVTFGQRPRR